MAFTPDPFFFVSLVEIEKRGWEYFHLSRYEKINVPFSRQTPWCRAPPTPQLVPPQTPLAPTVSHSDTVCHSTCTCYRTTRTLPGSLRCIRFVHSNFSEH